MTETSKYLGRNEAIPKDNHQIFRNSITGTEMYTEILALPNTRVTQTRKKRYYKELNYITLYPVLAFSLHISVLQLYVPDKE